MTKVRSRVSHQSWWICGIVGTLIGLIVSEGKDVGMYVFVGISNGLFWGWILGLLIDAILNSKSVENIEKKVEKIKTNQVLAKSTKESLAKYNDAKNRFQYLSSERLTEKFNEYTKSEKSDMIRLALEEEMVKRGLISFSPMHEKLDKINGVFNNEA